MELYLKIINDSTGTEEVGNYRYEVKINEEVLEIGEFKDFQRFLGWELLLAKVAHRILVDIES